MNPEQRTFTDARNRRWDLTLDFPKAAALDADGLNVWRWTEPGSSILNKPSDLFALFVGLMRGQHGVTGENEISDVLLGDEGATMDAARKALTASLIHFTQDPAQRKAYERLYERSLQDEAETLERVPGLVDRAYDEMREKAQEKLTGTTPTDSGDASTNSPESPE